MEFFNINRDTTIFFIASVSTSAFKSRFNTIQTYMKAILPVSKEVAVLGASHKIL